MLGQACRSISTGYQWDQRQEWEGQEMALWGYKRGRRYTGSEVEPGEPGAGKAGGGMLSLPGTYTFWWSLTRFRRTLICKRNAGGC